MILLQNLTPTQELCNSMHVLLIKKHQHMLQVMILGGQHNSEVAFIPHISLLPSTQLRMTFCLRCHQFPMWLAFILTINKAQGQSVQHVRIDLCEPVFSHSQLYVTLSRATSHEHVKILLPRSCSESCTHNVVYLENFHMLKNS